MQIHQDWQWLSPEARGASVAMGNFDGVHLGHQAVIAMARQHGPLGIVTFEPHPRQFFSDDPAPFRLMNAEARATALAKIGVQHLYQIPFDHKTASMSPESFVREVLIEGLGIRHVVTGEDFSFGKGRAGNARSLREMGARFGFGTTIAPILTREGKSVSSTAIRAALSEGRPRDAADMLGHLHSLEGEVVHGEKRGRTLGFPTANMNLTDLHLPRFGVYAARVEVLSGAQSGSYMGAVSLGQRPMFNGLVPNLESYLLDFKGDLYGHRISVGLVEYLRPELKFDGLPALVAQMEADCLRAREILTAE